MITSQQQTGGLSAADAVVSLAVSGYGSVAIQVTETFTGTITFEGSGDGQNWFELLMAPSTGSTAATTTTTTGLFTASVAGLLSVRARMSSYTSGRAFIVVRAIPAGGASASSSGGGGGGGAVTIANGADVTQGAIADAAVTGDNSGTVNAHLRGLDKIAADTWDSVNHRTNVAVQNTPAVSQSGAWTVSGTGTAGTAASGVLTVQGIASMTAVKVDGSAVTQPVSGTVTAAQATASSLNATVVGTGTFATQATLNASATATGCDSNYVACGASTNSTSVKGSAGLLYGYECFNTTATVYYLRLYNSASAPTASSATGYVRSIPIPANTAGNGLVSNRTIGETFSTGIGFVVTGGASSTDNTNAATGVFVTLFYK